jgi:hypothetical protein
MNSLGSQIAGAIGLHDNTGPLAIGGGAALALIGLVLAVQKDNTMATQTVPSLQAAPSVQAVLPGTHLATPSKVPPSMASPELLASLKAQLEIVATNLANEELLAVVVGHIQAGNKINAIRSLREMTHCGLKEGKDLVDEVDSRHEDYDKGRVNDAYDVPGAFVIAPLKAKLRANLTN